MPNVKAQTYLTADEVAARLQVTTRVVQKWCTAGLFPGAFKAGTGATSPWRIPPGAYEAFVKYLKENAQADKV